MARSLYYNADNGKRFFVDVPRSAEIRPFYLKNSSSFTMIQRILDSVEAWPAPNQGVRVITRKTSLTLPVSVVEIKNQRLQFGIVSYHTARDPQPSPIVRAREVPRTDLFTVEIASSVRSGRWQLRLVRGYPGGTYIPPLPWQSSGHGSLESQMFWDYNAYAYDPGIVRNNELQDEAPDWFRAHARS